MKYIRKFWVWLKETIHKFLNWFDSFMSPAPVVKKRDREGIRQNAKAQAQGLFTNDVPQQNI